MIDEVVKLFRYYRNEVGGNYEAREFALPDRLKFFPLYLNTILSQPCFNFKLKTNEDVAFHYLMELLQCPLVNFFYLLYPKIFDLETFYEESQKNENFQPGYEVDGEIALPDSIPANSVIMQSSSVYLIDDGKYFYFYVSS